MEPNSLSLTDMHGNQHMNLFSKQRWNITLLENLVLYELIRVKLAQYSKTITKLTFWRVSLSSE